LLLEGLGRGLVDGGFDTHGELGHEGFAGLYRLLEALGKTRICA
jgi:hypothetical protein